METANKCSNIISGLEITKTDHVEIKMDPGSLIQLSGNTVMDISGKDCALSVGPAKSLDITYNRITYDPA